MFLSTRRRVRRRPIVDAEDSSGGIVRESGRPGRLGSGSPAPRDFGALTVKCAERLGTWRDFNSILMACARGRIRFELICCGCARRRGVAGLAHVEMMHVIESPATRSDLP